MKKLVIQPGNALSHVPQLILVDMANQALYLQEATSERSARVIKSYTISTSCQGPGEQQGSGKTPRGWHIIRAKIGQGYPPNTVFVGRRATGEIYSSSLEEIYPQRDWILSRILWLSGLEVGKNRLGDCDTMRRFIYIHGCPDILPLGSPQSKGCIRMHNQDIIELFESVTVGTKVFIRE